MKLLVTGGREWRDGGFVSRQLWAIHRKTPIKVLVEGGATGWDEYCRLWAESQGIEVRTYKAEWSRYGKRAGGIRNLVMLVQEQPDLVLAGPGGKGTRNMIAHAKTQGYKVLEVKP